MFTFCRRPQWLHITDCIATGYHLERNNTCSASCVLIFKFASYKNKTTSLTNHWQKAGPIHSLAWTPQSIHTAFFWGRLLFPSWQETSTVSFGVTQICLSMHLCVCVYVGFVCVCLMPSLLPEAHKAVFLRTTSRWRTCQPGQGGFCSSQTSTTGS